MRIYKAPDNSLHCIEPEFANLLPAGCAEITEAEAESLRQKPQEPTYADLRALEFAKKSIVEQLDMQYWDAVNGTTLWVDWVAGIKAQFPKP